MTSHVCPYQMIWLRFQSKSFFLHLISLFFFWHALSHFRFTCDLDFSCDRLLLAAQKSNVEVWIMICVFLAQILPLLMHGILMFDSFPFPFYQLLSLFHCWLLSSDTFFSFFLLLPEKSFRVWDFRIMARGILSDIMQLYKCIHALEQRNTMLLQKHQYYFLHVKSLTADDMHREIFPTLLPLIN